MKLSFGFRLPRRRKRRAGDGIRAIKAQIYVLIALTALIPLSFFFFICFNQISNVVRDNAVALAETLRDARTERIKTSIFEAFGDAASAAAYALDSGTLTGYNAPDTLKPLARALERNRSIERLALYSAFFEPLAAVDSDGEVTRQSLHERIRNRLPDIRFHSDEIVFELDLGDKTSRLILFARIMNETESGAASNASPRGYVTATYNYDVLAELLSAPPDVRISVFNGRYQQIADSFGLSNWKLVINALTERMLDGFAETRSDDAEVHAYGYVDLSTTELFIDVRVPLSIGSSRLDSFIVTFIFFFVVVALSAVAVSWVHVRSIVRYGETILVRKRFTKEMRLFSGLLTSVDSVQSRLSGVADLQLQIDKLKTDLNRLVDRIPSSDSDDGK